MAACLNTYCKPYHAGLVVVLAFLLSAWTCTAIVDFDNCTDPAPQPHVISLSPDTIPANSVPALIVVDGTGFSPQSEILWNGNSLQTTFLDSRHLQATITQQTFNLFGGSAGVTVLISVRSPASSSVVRCSNGGVQARSFFSSSSAVPRFTFQLQGGQRKRALHGKLRPL
jgi:hypothetical protein